MLMNFKFNEKTAVEKTLFSDRLFSAMIEARVWTI
jgi:hypothetical protein